MVEAIIVLIFVVFFGTVTIGVQILRVIFRLDKIHDVLVKEHVANARHRLGGR